MDAPYTPQRTIDERTRRSLARELSRFYHEVADDPPAPRFSLASVLEQMSHERGLSSGYERELCSATAMAHGETFDRNRIMIPFGALATRDLTAGSPSGGGYLIGTGTAEPIDVLRPWSVVAQAGATVVTGLRENLAVPRVTTASSAQWIGTEATSYPDSTPTIGSLTLTPKTAAASVLFSRQWRTQGAEGAELLLRQQLLGAVGQLLDQAFFAAGGGAAPVGLLGTSGIGTQAGGSLNHAGVLAMRSAVLTAGAVESNLAWVSTPAVQAVLGGRERSAGGGRFLWDTDGVLGRPAFATKNAATGALVLGDFSKAIVALWGSAIRVEVNPVQNFIAGGLAARVVIHADVGFPVPAAFCAASSVT